MPPRFDHAVIIVPSLKTAVRRFERLGFQVVMGGRTGPVHNALILFSDGTYIELTTNRFSVARPLCRALHATGLIGRVAAKRDDMLQRFLPWIGAPQGAADWCIRVDDIRATIGLLREAGVEMLDEMAFERVRPDGQVAQWLLAGPSDLRLPFFIEDLTPVEIRVPFREHSEHPNAITGIHRLILPQSDKDAVERMLGCLIGADAVPTSTDAEAFGSVHIGAADDASGLPQRFALELLQPAGSDETLESSRMCGVPLAIVHRL